MTERAPMTRRQRADRMAALYATGATLDEVGREFNLTRERIRQILVKHGNDMDRLKQESMRARRARVTNENESAIRELLAAGHSPSTVAGTLRVPLRAVQEIDLGQPELARARRLRPSKGSPVYADEELLECLRIANGELGGVMTSVEYNELGSGRRLADGRAWPGRQTAMSRFGSWRRALEAAGLPANPSSPMAGRRLFDKAHCIDAILEVERVLDRLPTASEYETYARTMNGALPSLATIRHRYGSWRAAMAHAIAFRLSH